MFGKIILFVERWRAWLAGAVVLLLFILFFPFQSTTVPGWRVRIVDETGAIVPNISVTEHWQHYLLESAGHEEARLTDRSGQVDFPERTVRAGLVSRAVDALISFARQGTKAKMGPYASLVVWGSRDHEIAVATYTPGAPTQNEVVVHRR